MKYAALALTFFFLPTLVSAQTAPAEKCTTDGAARDKTITIETGAEVDCSAFTGTKKTTCEKENAAAKAAKTTDVIKQTCKNGIWTNLVPAGAGDSPSLFCFTQDECTSAEYGGALDRFVPGQGCPTKFGKCLAPEPIIPLSSPVLGQTSVQGFRSYVLLMFNYLLNIVVIAAAVMFVYGGFRYIVGSSFGDIKAAKERMVNATIGLVLTFSAVILLQTVNPATLRLDAVKVYLIKRIEFSLVNRCDLLKPKNGKEVKFSDAGSPPGAIPFDADPSKFIIGGKETQCGKKYYVQGTTGQTCSGNVCSGTDAKKTCSSCTGIGAAKAPQCAGKDRACLNIPFGGTIGWKDSTYPIDVYLVPVCGHATPGNGNVATTPSDIGAKMPSIIYPGTIFNKNGGETGDTTYTFPLADRTLIDAMKCEKEGGPNGVVLAVKYHDNCGWEQALASKSGSTGLLEAGARIGECMASPNDLLIVTKQDCIGATYRDKSYQPYFSGYAMGKGSGAVDNSIVGSFISPVGNVHDLFVEAIWCGWTNRPMQGSYNLRNKRTISTLAPKDRTRFMFNDTAALNPYWSWNEIDKAQRGEESIECSFNLTAQTAPRNPNMILFGGCTVDWNGIKDVGPSGMPDFKSVPSFMPSDIIDFYAK